TKRYEMGGQIIGTRDERFFDILSYIEKDLAIPEEKSRLSPRALTERGVLTIASIQEEDERKSQPLLFTAMPGFEDQMAIPVIQRVGPAQYDILIELTSRVTGKP